MEQDQVDAAEWLEKNMTEQGEKNLMLAHGNVGSSKQAYKDRHSVTELTDDHIAEICQEVEGQS